MMPSNKIQERTNRRQVSRGTSFIARSEARDNGPDDLIIEGYFNVFDDIYELWPGATESVQKGAFAGVLGSDVRALINHDSTLVLGRTTAGTLTLREDERGLFGRIVINQDDADAMNLYSRVKRGDVDQCSFGFEIAEEHVDIKPDGSVHWTIIRVDPLYEVSVVTFPAYEATSVSARRNDLDTILERKAQAWRDKSIKRLKKEENTHGT